MRYVYSLPPVTTAPSNWQLRRASAAAAVKPVSPREQTIPYVEQTPAHQAALDTAAHQQRRAGPAEDRRKVCRRVSQQPVLEELRSGIERRKNSSRNGDMVDHIDIEV